MTERDRIIDAFRNCITEPKCKDCPWDECDTLYNRCIEIPENLALAVMRELVAREPVEPIKDGDGDWICGACNEGIVGCGVFDVAGIEDIRNEHCPKCGRAVKWG